MAAPKSYTEALHQTAKSLIDRYIEVLIFAEAATNLMTAEIPDWQAKLHKEKEIVRPSVLRMNQGITAMLEPETFQGMILGLLRDLGHTPKNQEN